MNITYTFDKKFNVTQVQNLFLSVGWVSGQYPQRLYQALQNSSTVLTAWTGDRLVGLIRVLDDGGMMAYLHYVLVDPAYHGQGIAKEMMNCILDLYKDYFYLEVMPEESKNASFYEHFGFHIMSDGVPMQIVHSGHKH